MSELIRVPFHGDVIEAVQDREGNVWCPVKRICERLGLDPWSQVAKLKEKPWATTGMIPAVAEDGKLREMFCVERECLPMWLATIEASRVGEDVRPLLVLYQKEAAKVLADHFIRGGPAPLDLSALKSVLVEMCQVVVSQALAQIVPLMGARETGLPVGIRERIRQRWPQADEAHKTRVVQRVKGRTFRRHSPAYQTVENGPLVVDQSDLWIVDEEIDREQDRVREGGDFPLFERHGYASAN